MQVYWKYPEELVLEEVRGAGLGEKVVKLNGAVPYPIRAFIAGTFFRALLP